MDASNQSGSVKAVVVVTTDKVYKNTNNSKSFVESDPLEGKDPYSASKVATESVAAAWRQISKISGGTPNISVRAGNVIGGGDWSKDRLIPDLVRGFLRSEKVQIRNSASTRPWQHVLDPLHGYLLALNSILEGSPHEFFNFGPQGKSLSVSSVVEIASKNWPMDTRIEYVESVSTQEATTLELNSTSAKDNLGWSPAWNQEEAVTSTMNWWKNVMLSHTPPAEECAKDINWLMTKMKIKK
jgi:CDP-glucose 4,6-dehydratase